MLLNQAKKELTLKIVYYGPGLSGKTANIQAIHDQTDSRQRGKLVSLETNSERTLYFDFMPMDVNLLEDYQLHLHLYSVPGQVYYEANRREILKGADGLIFVADSQSDRMDANLMSLENMFEQMTEESMNVPWVIQYNKRDLPGVLPVEEMDRSLNEAGVQCFEAAAHRGEGVFEPLKAVLKEIRKKTLAHSTS